MKTIVFIYLVINVLISGILVLLWAQNKMRFSGISFWLADYILQAIGQLLILLRGQIPDVISIIISNTIIIVGIILFYIGLRRFIGRQGLEALYFLYIPIFMTVHAYFVYVTPSLTFRSINTSIGIAIFSLLCSYIMLTIPNLELRRIGRGTGIVFLLYSIFAVSRIVLVSIIPEGNDYFKVGPYDILSIFIFMLFGILLTYTLILMINGRLLLEIQGFAAETKKIAYNLGERVKELNCLYAITSLEEKPGLSIKEILASAVALIPAALQYPGSAGARIVYHGAEFIAGEKLAPLSSIGSDIIEHGAAVGRVEAFYSTEVASGTEDPFWEEERVMIRAVSKHLGDIIEKLNSTNEVHKLLAEKELLLTEVHHRIKNNMSSITSLLAIQADNADNETTAAALTGAKNRVFTMMELYDRLYRQDEFDSIGAKEYFSSLMKELSAAYDADGSIAIEIDVDDISLSTRQVFPLGLIVNELVTNSFKYAFTGNAAHRIFFSLHEKKDKSLEIVVSDNGTGLKKKRGGTGGFGLILVDTLTRETGGAYVVSSDGGTCYSITIPRKEH